MLDIEQVFVVSCIHDEQGFAVTALWLAPTPSPAPVRPTGLRPVAAGEAPPGDGWGDGWDDGWDGGDRPAPPLSLVPDRGQGRYRRGRTSPLVRRRRALLAVTALLLVGLALPLGGTGGRSHPTGSVLAGTGGTLEYTVQPGDSLWSIAQRVDPAADPRPLVAELARRTGSEVVVPGQRISLP